jgi:hypothetical protein
LLFDDNFELPSAKSLFLLPFVPLGLVVGFCGLFSGAVRALAGLELER